MSCTLLVLYKEVLYFPRISAIAGLCGFFVNMCVLCFFLGENNEEFYHIQTIKYIFHALLTHKNYNKNRKNSINKQIGQPLVVGVGEGVQGRPGCGGGSGVWLGMVL